jgi:predicted O-methyltransferase YrrM
MTKGPADSTRIRLTTHLRDKTARLLFRALISLPRRTALSFSEVKRLARIPSSYDALSLWQRERVKHPEPAMAREHVSKIVAEAEKDPFTAGTEALNFLDDCVKRLRPRAILEFGGGVSTLVFAARMAELHRENGPRVFSIDESQNYLEATHHMLDSVGLADRVRLARREVHDQVICGRATACYDIDEDFLRSFLPITPDVVFIDGPSGGGMGRFGTLPLVLRHLDPGCTFFLDDALRHDEIQVASLWQVFPEIEFTALHVVGHGLLEGRVVQAHVGPVQDPLLLLEQ